MDTASHAHHLDELYRTCVHCGLCLQTCPTYRELGYEMDSPRGRIRQVMLVDTGQLQLGPTVVTHLDRCLACRACETVCPSGVKYGQIIEAARVRIEREYRRPLFARMARRAGYATIADFGRLARTARLLRWYQRSGLQRLVRGSGVLRALGIERLESMAPAIDSDFFFREFGKVFPAEGARRARVAFLAGCIAGVAFSELNRATVRVLQRNGVEVWVPPAQGCCGALHVHAGLAEEAQKMAQRNIEAMLRDDVDAIVTNAAGCGTTTKEYGSLLCGDSQWSERARLFSAKVRDISEFLIELGPVAPGTKLAARVTYQDPCHLAHGQRVRSAPRELLRLAAGEFLEMPRADSCCGSAGVYNVSENQLSMQILEAKMKDVASVQADVLATANVGCMLQLRAGVARRGVHMKVQHVVEVLDEAYRAE
ncbi:MAG: 4Fe-4S dicluster domain-containing protein [Acidobacteria bacterium]|nr:4Fe-4S dicluster domain-containing protein [Acidobacteriota bacterium]